MKNIGLTDRTLRITLAAAILLIYLTGIVSGIFAIVLIAIGTVLLLTALVSVCPLYLLFGITSCKHEPGVTNKS
jgi:hypothetical protein